MIYTPASEDNGAVCHLVLSYNIYFSVSVHINPFLSVFQGSVHHHSRPWPYLNVASELARKGHQGKSHLSNTGMNMRVIFGPPCQHSKNSLVSLVCGTFA